MGKSKFLTRLVSAVSVFVAGVMVFGTASFADVVWEPDNSFYDRHSGECSYADRAYQANSPYDDGLKIYESPESDEVIAVVENGEYVYIAYIYTDKAGNDWGLSENHSGWVPMDYLANIYDSKEFIEQYRDVIKDKSGEIKLEDHSDDATLYFYDYPGAKIPSTSIIGDDNPYYSMYFVDPEGHEWGYVSYYYISKGWVCIDDTSATYEELYPNGQDFSGVIGAAAKPTVIVEPVKSVNVMLIVGIVIGVIVAASVVILVVILKKTKSSKK